MFIFTLYEIKSMVSDDNGVTLPMKRRNVVIGKTTLGDKINENFKGIIAIDTDGLLEYGTKEADELKIIANDETDKDHKKYIKRWKEIFIGAINQKIKEIDTNNRKCLENHETNTDKCKIIRVIVFVGILDHFGPPDETILEFDTTETKDLIDGAVEKYYIDIELPELLW